jgi:DNA invertase Pin-like site-specific DNA recombinase
MPPAPSRRQHAPAHRVLLSKLSVRERNPTLLAAVAEDERERLRERTKARILILEF